MEGLRSSTRAPRTIRLAGALIVALALCCAQRPHSDWPGIKEWVRESFPEAPLVSVDELERNLSDPDAPQPVLLDAREPDEWAVSHLKGALLAPDERAALADLDGLPLDTPIVVYCSVGYRSGALTEKLMKRGYTDVQNLEGSIFEWANRGLPVYREGREVTEVHSFDEEWGRLLDAEHRSSK